jgi:hypothetical protein
MLRNNITGQIDEQKDRQPYRSTDCFSNLRLFDKKKYLPDENQEF